LFHRMTRTDAAGREVAACEEEVAYAVGSGTRGYSYLSDRGGYLFFTPISWYAQAGKWDLSPGLEDRDHPTGRPVRPHCLFSPAHHADHVPHTATRSRAPVFRGHAIGCERCHGPGELHVGRQERGAAADGADDTIVNPARLAPELREAVCEQCHLEGEARVVRRGRGVFDYRPGLPLHLFWSVFVKARELSDDHRAVSHVEQMH